MNSLDFIKYKREKKKISMITCYDSTSALIASKTNVDVILVGDSAAMTMHGYSTTLSANVEMMRFHTQAVASKKGSQFLVSDMPFLSFRKGLVSAMETCDVLMKAGAEAVKLEGVDGHEDVVEGIVKSGIPVMGHLGLTPQSVHQLGGYRVQGKNSDHAQQLIEFAKRLEDLGCFSIVLECIPSELAKQITEQLTIPTIGIGAGIHVDGQVLVWQDLLGLNTEFQPKFVKTYIDGAALFQAALNTFDREVKAEKFPTEKESYHGINQEPTSMERSEKEFIL